MTSVYKNMRSVFARCTSLATAFIVFSATQVFAQTSGDGDGLTGGGDGGGDGGGLTGGGDGGGTTAAGLVNPLKSETITGFLTDILDILLTFAVPVIVFFIIYSGYLFVTAQGDTSKVTEARKALTWSVVGGVIILGAKVILAVIKGTIDGVTNGLV